MARPKPMGRSGFQGRREPHTLRPAEMNARTRAREFGELLAAAPAGEHSSARSVNTTTSAISRSPAATMAPMAVASAHCPTGYAAFSTLHPA